MKGRGRKIGRGGKGKGRKERGGGEGDGRGKKNDRDGTEKRQTTKPGGFSYVV
jgi:hypothetical protein